MNVLLSIYVISLIAFVIHLYKLSPHERSLGKGVELFLLYQIVFSLGLTSILSFFGLTFMADFVADYTGWARSPFEQQLANVNLAFGVLGIASIWFRGNFWIATILGFSIWILGDAIHHFSLWALQGNDYPGNIGVPLYTDIAVPTLLLGLLAFHLKLQKTHTTDIA